MSLVIWRLLLPPIVLGRIESIRLMVEWLAATKGPSLASELLLRRLKVLPASPLRTQHAAPAAPLTSPLSVHDPSTIESLHNSAEYDL